MIDPTHPLESMARVYLHPILNRATGHKLDSMKRMVDEFRARRGDPPLGSLLQALLPRADRSARAAGQDAGVPALLLEADHNDPRAFSEEQVEHPARRLHRDGAARVSRVAALGIDAGSTTSKLVGVDQDGAIVARARADRAPHRGQVRRMLEAIRAEHGADTSVPTIATGYGRKLVKRPRET